MTWESDVVEAGNRGHCEQHVVDTLSHEVVDEAVIVAVKVRDQDTGENRQHAIGKLCLMGSASQFLHLVPDRIILHTYGSEPKGTSSAVFGSQVAALS